MSRTIIVTGGVGVLGRAVVAHVQSRGWTAVPVDIAPEVPGGVGGVDLTDEAAVVEAYDQITKSQGQIHGVANVAGGFVWELVGDGSVETFDQMYRMNLRTATVSCRAAMPHLGQGASIVNVGAAAANDVAAGMASYAASKAGVAALTESLSAELVARGIRVNAVLPTILDTPRNRADMPDANVSDWVHPDDAASAIGFLLSPEAHAVTGAQLRLALGRSAH